MTISLPFALTGFSPFLVFDRDVARDEMAMLAGHSEFIQNHVAHLFVVTQVVIGAFLFLVQRLSLTK